MKMNKQLLLKVAALIKAEPRKLDMSVIISRDMRQLENPPPCGTVGCIAGWAMRVSGKRTTDALLRSPELLGIDYDQAQRLFFVENWPERFRIGYSAATTPKARARVTVTRIKHFIKTKGR